MNYTGAILNEANWYLATGTTSDNQLSYITK
jgi:hypothetical protein